MNPFDLIVFFLLICFFCFSFKGILQEAASTLGIILGYLFSTQTYFHYSTILKPLSLNSRAENLLAFSFVFLLFNVVGVFSGYITATILGFKSPSISNRVLGAVISTPFKVTFFSLALIFVVSRWLRGLSVGWASSVSFPVIQKIENIALSVF